MKYSNPISSKTTIEQAFCQIILCELKSIKKWRKIAIKGKDPEGVHQVRISLRRIRTALTIFKPIIATKFSRTLAKKLKKYAKVLDDARDQDVYILIHLMDNTDSLIASYANTQRRIAYQQVKKLLTSKSFNKHIRTCKKWVTIKRHHKKIISDKTLNNSLELFAFKTLDTLRNSIIYQGQQVGQLDDLALHKLRIDCKKLRYTVEFFKLLYDENISNSFLEELKKLQDSLGAIHDAFIQKQLHQSLLQKNDKLADTPDSQHILLKIEQISETKNAQLINDLAAFFQSDYPWVTPP
ncbi:MAG: CHAD domain-containing protein [Gammaproteobacteria bacterium]|nr:CHAD domain-containing protein [Gammaproteobacteria bacterium]